jgi:hypothetical protein
VLGVLTAGLLALSGCGSSSGTSSPSSTGPSTPPSSAAQPTSTSSATQPSTPHVPSISTGTVTAGAGGVTATLHAGTHHPRANRPWPIQFIASRGGHAVRASVSYEYLFAGQVVAHRSHFTFSGHFSDIFIWPTAAVGYPLTFRAVIVSEGVTINLDYPVQVSA